MAVVDREEVAREMTAKLTADQNVLAVAVCAGQEKEDKPIELLIVVSRIPFDLDGYGRRTVKWRDSALLLSHYTPQWLKATIDDEAGCWMTSGKVLYSKTTHDPGGVLLSLRKAVNSVNAEDRMAAFRRWLDEASAFPAIVLRRGPSLTTASQRTLLRDNPALARALFLLNGQPPRSEETMLDDLMELERLPPGAGEITQVIRGLDRYDLKRFEEARKKYEAFIQGVVTISGLGR